MNKAIVVGGSLGEAAARVVDTWKRAERGEAVTPQDRVTFATWSALAAVMTDKRHALLQHLHRAPVAGIRALARELGRDYKRVYQDVQALAAVGLIERDGGLLRADYDEIRASIRLDPAA
jgi:predicted transcriptional regulator